MKQKITTIIPTFRRPEQLKRAIRSVLQQSYPEFQLCVYDNASGDETASVVAQLAKTDSRIKYFCHTENIGAVNNFQFGMERVTTPFFSFLSDDDYLFPGFYESALAGFETHPGSMFSATDVVHVDGRNNILTVALEAWTPGAYLPPLGLKKILDYGHSEWTGILFRRSVIETVGNLDAETGRFVDLDFTLRIAARCPFVVCKEIGAVFSLFETREPYPLDMNWPGVGKMIGNLTNDESLPADVRAYAKSIIWERFEKDLFKSGISCVSRGRLGEAKRVADLLHRLFSRTWRDFALRAFILAHKFIPFAGPVFRCMNSCRRYLRAKRTERNQHRYREIRPMLAAD